MSDELFQPKRNIILCRVCLVVVPMRKEYSPTICEACQKFFRRNCGHHKELVCSGENRKCVIDEKNRRFCARCRFDRCLVVGMRSKFLRRKPELSVRSELDQSSGSSLDKPASNGFEFDSTPVMQQESNNSSFGFNQYVSISDYRQDTRADLVESEPPSVANNETGTNNTSICPVNMQLVRDPALLDGSVIEGLTVTSVQAFTRLHSLEFVVLKRPSQPVEDIRTLGELGVEQFRQGISILRNYGQQFACDYSAYLTPDDMKSLMENSLAPIAAVFNNLEAYQGGNFFGLNNALLPMFLSYFPEFQDVNDSIKELSAALSNWNPSLVDCSMLLGVLFFDENSSNNNKSRRRIFEFRHRLLSAYNMHVSSKAYGDQTRIEKQRRHFNECMRLTFNVLSKTKHWTAMFAYRSPMFEMAHSLVKSTSNSPLPDNRNNMLILS